MTTLVHTLPRASAPDLPVQRHKCRLPDVRVLELVAMKVPNSRVKACTECRQQKLRCDASQHPKGTGCTRCRRRNLQCVISSNYTRQKRKTKSELQAELDAIKSNIQNPTQSSPGSPSQHSTQTAIPSHMSPPGVSLAPRTSYPAPLLPLPTLGPCISPGTSLSSPSARLLLPPVPNRPAALSALTPAETTEIPSPTIGRLLEDNFVSPQSLEDCFQEFFTRYSPQLPAVETELKPNACFAQSPFLFWTIVSIGSRKYAGDPTLLSQLAPAVTRLAKEAAFMPRNEKTVYTIQALILLCVWPSPYSSLSEDITPMLAGALLQQALAVGLHIFGVGQDFSRIKLKKDRSQMDFRARLWAWCIIICQRVSCTDGVPPIVIPDNYDHEYTQAQTLHALPAQLRFHKTLSRILTESILELERFALFKSAEHRATTLNPIIDAASLSMARMEPECRDEVDRFYLVCAELQLLAFHLLAPRESFEPAKLAKMYRLACTAIEVIQQLSDRTGTQAARYAPQAWQKYLALAAFTILKLSRGPSTICDSLPLARGRAAYFAVLEMCRECSLESGDMGARLRTILTQLWTSKRIFRKADGTTDALSLRCGSRLAMSISFDMYWWWRAEFGGVPNPYEDSTSNNGTAQEPDAVATEMSPESLTNLMGWQESFPEFLWPTTDDMLSMEWGLPTADTGLVTGSSVVGASNAWA